MITLSLLQYLEDNNIGTIDENMFWQNLGLDAEGLYIVNIGQAQNRGQRRVQRYEIYVRMERKDLGLKMLEEVIDLIDKSYGICDLPAVQDYVDGYHNITLLPLSTPTRVGEDANGRVIWSASGSIIY